MFTLTNAERSAIIDAFNNLPVSLSLEEVDALCERLSVVDAELIGGECIDANLYLRAYNGKLVRVVAVFPVGDDKQPGATDVANAYMAANPGIGLLAINRGLAYLAANSDEGTKPEKLGGVSETMPAPEAEAATVQISVELDADFVDSVLTSAIEQGYPWFDWEVVETGEGTQPGDLGYYRAAMVTEYNPDEGSPVDGAEPVRVDAKAIALGISRILSSEVKAGCRDDIAAAVAERDAGHIDVDMADCIIQAAVLGELRYG